MGGAGKWITATITTGAALAALLVNARNLGLHQYLGLADYSARRVWVTPRADTLLAVGDTTVLAATVTDERGMSLTGVNLRWESADVGVATVDSAGTVVARGPGVAVVTVSVRDLSARARVAVRQVPVAVEILGDSVVGLLEGDTALFTAQTLDARGHPIREMAPHWRSDDTAVVRVDSLGRTFALAPGWAALTAAQGDYAARIAVQVELAPTAIELVSGGEQRMPAGRALPRPVIVRVVSAQGTPIPDVPVAFVPSDGEGAVAPDTVLTNRAGQARTSWTLSDRPGRQQLVVSTCVLDSTLAVVAEVDPVPDNTTVTALDTLLAGVVGDSLSEPVVVRVADSTGAALADVPVAWTALDRGTVEPLGERTDSLGEARARWTLGPRTGGQRLRVQVGNPRTLPPVTITATARPRPAARLLTVSGDQQSGTVGTMLSKAVVVSARDSFGNGVPGVELRVAGGMVADTVLMTDSAGRATIRWTLGRVAGVDTLSVRGRGVDGMATATARARPGTAANIAFAEPPARGTAGTRVRLAAVVTDAYGNPVPNAMVVFMAAGGTLSASRVAADSAGRAATRWTPGAAAGDQVVSATLRGTSAKAAHTVRVTAPAKRQ